MNFEQKKIKVKGITYTLQQVPATWYMDIADKARSEKLSTTDYLNEMFANVVVMPGKLKVSDFDGRIKEMQAIIKAAENFVMGEEVDVEEVDQETKNVEELPEIEQG